MENVSTFKIIADANCDMPQSFFKKNDITVLELIYTLDGVSHTTFDPAVTLHQFYDRMRDGSDPKTAQITPDQAFAAMDQILGQGYDVLYFSFSSGISGSYNSARLAAEDAREKYPERKVIVIDSLCASMGAGLLLYYGVKMQQQGKSIDEVAQWLENNKLNLCHFFTVEDLKYLQKGGRVSKTVAVVGTVLGIKPVLHVDNEGKLVPVNKVRGRKQSLNALVDYYETLGDRDRNEIFFISHGDCEEEANYVASEMKRRYGLSNYMINGIGPTIGAHSGPGTMALFFLGKHR